MSRPIINVNANTIILPRDDRDIPARAQSAAGDKAGARQTYAELKKMWNRADPPAIALIEK